MFLCGCNLVIGVIPYSVNRVGPYVCKIILFFIFYKQMNVYIVKKISNNIVKM